MENNILTRTLKIKNNSKLKIEIHVLPLKGQIVFRGMYRFKGNWISMSEKTFNKGDDNTFFSNIIKSTYNDLVSAVEFLELVNGYLTDVDGLEFIEDSN